MMNIAGEEEEQQQQQQQQQQLSSSASLMQDALRMLSTAEARKSGLSNDPLTLLLLCMEPDVLEEQIAVGRHLLRTLSAGGKMLQLADSQSSSAWRALIQEVRAHLLSSDDYWNDLDGWREILLQKCADALRGNKGEVMNALGERIERKGPCCFTPSLLQIVFDRREGKQHSPRTHVILERWTQVLVFTHEALFRRSHQSVVHDVPRQIVEVPTDYSVRKFYQDWDCTLSKVEGSGFFDRLDESLLSRAEFDASILHSSTSAPRDYPWKVQLLRRIALQTPQVVCKMLAQMRCFRSEVGMMDEDSMFVLVKEGTRRVVDKAKSSSGPGAVAQGDQQPKEDWKISFHFVFQVAVSHFQFKCLYEMITSLISSTSFDCNGFFKGGHDVAYALELIDERDYEQLCGNEMKRAKTTPAEGSVNQVAAHQAADHASLKKTALKRCLEGALESIEGSTHAVHGPEPNLGPLVGMDLHPLQTEFQGLACLGSWKDGAERGNSLLGMMQIPLSQYTGQRCCVEASSSLASRTVRGWSWVEGYCQRTPMLLVLAEASTIMPGPRCIGLSSMDSWEPMVHSSRRKAADKDTADRALSETHNRGSDSDNEALGSNRALDSSLIECKQRLQQGVDRLLRRAPKLKAVACTYMGADNVWRVRQVKSVMKLVSKNGNERVPKPHMELCHQMLSGSAGLGHYGGVTAEYGKSDVMERVPRWFRKCLNSLFASSSKATGGRSSSVDAWQMAFRSSSVNVRYAHVPDELVGVRSECRLIHVSTHAMRICTLELMRVPFVVSCRPSQLCDCSLPACMDCLSNSFSNSDMF